MKECGIITSDGETDMEKILDRTKLFKKFQNRWVALTDNGKVISSGPTLDIVLTKARKKGFDAPVTIRIPDLKYELVL